MFKKTALLLALFGLFTAAHAQQTLAELYSGVRVEWLIGQWQYESDNGNVISLSFKTELDKHVVAVEYKDQRSETKGMIFLPPGTTEPKYYSGDNKGGVGTGVWSAKDSKAILKHKHTGSDGKVTKMAMTFMKVDDETMEVKVFELDDQDQLGSEARVTTMFKRTKTVKP